jgi:hypothetical protein
VQRRAGAGHQRSHAQLGEHGGGRFHLGGPAPRVLDGAADDPLHGGRVGRRQLGGDVLPHPRFHPGRAGGLKRLDDGRRHALVEDAAQELLAGGETGRTVENLDLGAQGPQRAGEPRGPVPARQHGDAQAAPRHGRHHCDVGERHAAGLGDLG